MGRAGLHTWGWGESAHPELDEEEGIRGPLLVELLQATLLLGEFVVDLTHIHRLQGRVREGGVRLADVHKQVFAVLWGGPRTGSGERAREGRVRALQGDFRRAHGTPRPQSARYRVGVSLHLHEGGILEEPQPGGGDGAVLPHGRGGSS